MGLDMYLSAKKYHADVEWRSADERAEFQKLKSLSNVGTVIDKVHMPHIYLEVSVGYWRKQNAIHKWFVDNTANGQDDCRTSYVGRDSLEELRTLCQKVLDAPKDAESILPAQSGFFFGGTEYDEWYVSGLKATIEIIDNALSMPSEWEFEYHASW
jgi:hypothetical protein